MNWMNVACIDNAFLQFNFSAAYPISTMQILMPRPMQQSGFCAPCSGYNFSANTTQKCSLWKGKGFFRVQTE